MINKKITSISFWVAAVAFFGILRFSQATDISDWRDTHFEDPEGVGDGNNRADPDQDRISNFMEYALGLDPLKVSPKHELPQIEEGGAAVGSGREKGQST
jgi:hypothetical protein